MRAGFYGIVLGMSGLLLALGTAPGYAAADGALGAVSLATTNVSLSIPEQFRVSGAEDMDLGSFSGSGDLSASSDVCVYSNGDGGYQVRITDNSSGSGFRLENDDHSAAVVMNVAWNDQPGTSGAEQASDGAAMPMSSANGSSSDCSNGGKNANISVNVSGSEMSVAPAGSYQSTLTIMVEPD